MTVSPPNSPSSSASRPSTAESDCESSKSVDVNVNVGGGIDVESRPGSSSSHRHDIHIGSVHPNAAVSQPQAPAVHGDPWAPRGLFRRSPPSGSTSSSSSSNHITSAVASASSTPKAGRDVDSGRMQFVNRIVHNHNRVILCHGLKENERDWSKTSHDLNLQFADFQYNYTYADGHHDHGRTAGTVRGSPTNLTFHLELTEQNTSTSVEAPLQHYFQDDLSLPLERRELQGEDMVVSAANNRPAQRRHSNSDGTLSRMESPVKKKQHPKQAHYFEEGMQWCNSLVKVAPHVHTHNVSDTSCYDQFGKLRASCHAHSKMVLATFHYNLGKCGEMQGHASSSSSSGEVLQAHEHSLHFTLAQVNYRDALQALEGMGAAAVESSDVQTLKTLIYMSMGQVEFQHKDFPRSFQHFQAAFRISQVAGGMDIDGECQKEHVPMAALLNGLGVSSYCCLTSGADEEDAEAPAQGRYDTPESKPSMTASLDYFERALAVRRGEMWNSPHSYQEVATILNNLGRVHHLMGHFGDAKACYSECLSIRKFVLGPFHVDVGGTMFNLGELERLDQDHGDADAARKMHQGFLDLVDHKAKQAQELDHGPPEKLPEDLNQMLTVSNAYLADYELSCHNYGAASALYTWAIHSANKARTQAGQEEHQAQVIAVLWNKLGHSWFEQGRWRAALDAYEFELELKQDEDVLADFDDLESVENRLRVLHQCAAAHTHLAEEAGDHDHDSLEAEQEYSAALKLYQQIFDLQEELRQKRASEQSAQEQWVAVDEMASTLLCMASVHLKQHANPVGVHKALKCVSQAKQMYLNSVDLVASQFYLGCFMSSLGGMLTMTAVYQYDAAQDLVMFDLLSDLAFRELVNSNKSLQSLSPNATEAQAGSVVSNLNNFSLLFKYQNNPARAIAYLGQSERWQIHFWGSDAGSLVETRFQIAVLLCEMGDFPQAHDVCQTVLQAQLRAVNEAPGQVHESLITRTRTKLAELYCEMGNLDLALAEYETVLQMQDALFSRGYSNHEELAETHLSIADIYRRQGNHESMLQAFDAAMPMTPTNFLRRIKWYSVRLEFPPHAAAA